MPPPESEVWPEEYRGENWKPVYAFLFEGKCQLCAHSCPLSKSRQMMDKYLGVTRLLQCTNHPANPGGTEEVLPIDTCRNFKAKRWRLLKAKPVEDVRPSMIRKSGRKVERIRLGDGLFATVDAVDYPEISRYRWYARRHGRNIYAVCFRRGRWVSMHRMIMRPRRGYIVDHKDGNGLNNCRDNLRVCTHRQNQANKRSSRGASRFVGVYRYKDTDRWMAGIRYRDKFLHIGIFDDEVEAAKARDRKAWELHGEFAYLNFPEDFVGKRRRKTATQRGASPTEKRR